MDDINRLAQKAVDFDHADKFDAAIYFYSDAANSLLKLIRDGSIAGEYRRTAEKYIDRAEQIKRRQCQLNSKQKSAQQLDSERAEFLLYQALENDERGNIDEAIDLYSAAIELCLETSKISDNVMLCNKLQVLATKALDRAECLKTRKSTFDAVKSLPPVPIDDLDKLTVDGSSTTIPRASSAPNIQRTTIGAKDQHYTKEELNVLRATSTINGRQYVPFMAVDLKERFAFPMPFSDKDGVLALSAKQKNRLKGWIRPDEFIDDPKIIDSIDSGTIKQVLINQDTRL